MSGNHKHFISQVLAVFLCFSCLVTSVTAEEQADPVSTEEPVVEVVEENAGEDISESTEETVQNDESSESLEAAEVTEETESEAADLVTEEITEEADTVLTDSITASGTCGTSLNWTLDDEGTLTISGEGDMYNYSESKPAPWDSYRSSVYMLTLADGMTHIGDYAFYNCGNLWGLMFPLELKSIGEYAFYGCNLPYIDLTEKIESIGNYAFGNCKSLTKVSIFGGPSHISANAFDGCDNLEEFYVSDDNQYFRVVDGWLCKGTELIFCPPKLRKSEMSLPEGITSVANNTFSGWKELKKVILPMSYPWYDFMKLGFGDSAGPVGSGCDIEFKGTSDSVPGYWYFNNNYYNYLNWNGTSLIIPEGVKTIEECAFDGFGNKNITIPSTVSYIDQSAFDDQQIEISEENAIYASVNGSILSKDKKTFYYYPISSPDECTVPNGVEIIAENAFSSDYGLKSVIFPEGVTTIQDGAFFGCDYLEEVYFPSTLMTIGYNAFYTYSDDRFLDVFYNGTRSDAQKISIDNGNFFDNWHFLGGEGEIDYSYLITFEKNNAKAAGSMKSLSGFLSDEKNLPANNFTCSGMTFVEWNTKADGSGYSYADKESVRMIIGSAEIRDDHADVTLYAQWAKKTYPVVYELDGGSDGPEIQYKIHGETLILSTKQPNKEGFVFMGWASTLVNARKGIVKYKAGTEVKYKNNARLTLFAVWKEKTFKVTYNANGGKNAPTAQTKYYTKTLILNDGLKKPTMKGYMVVGWEDRVKNIIHKPGTEYDVNEDVTLYAVWKPISYTIQFKGNGADNSELEPEFRIEYGESFKLESVYVRTGYTLNAKNAWKCSNKKTYAEGTEVKNLTTKNDDVITMTAQWTANTYIVKFDRGTVMFGEVTGKQMADKKLTYDKVAALPAVAYKAKGYEFDCWSLDNGEEYGNKEKVKNLTSSGEITLTALWKEIQYPINYIWNGGTEPAQYVKHTSVSSHAIVLPGSKTESGSYVPAPTRTGYKFAGWYTDKAFKQSSKIEMIPAGSAQVYTLYAKWNPNHYSVHYTAGAEDATGSMAAMTKEDVAYDAKFKLAANKYIREGYKFIGWKCLSIDPNHIYKVGSNGETVSKLTAEDGGIVWMTAAWEPNTVTLKLNSNYPDDTKNKTVTVKKTIEESVPGEVDGIDSSKGRIISWNTKADGSGVNYNVGDPVGNITKASRKTITLFAQWNCVSVPTVFYSNYDPGYENQCYLNTYAMLVEAIADRNVINQKLGTQYSDVREYMRGELCGGNPWQPAYNIHGMIAPFGLGAEFKQYTDPSGQYSEDFIKTELQKTSSYVGALVWNATAVVSEQEKYYGVPHMVMVYLDDKGELRLFDPGLPERIGKGVSYHNHVTEGIYWQDIILEDFYTVQRQ